MCSTCFGGSQFSSFPVEVGVKQGCVLAPNIFNLLLVAFILVSYRDLNSSDGDLFDLRRLLAKYKTSSEEIFAIRFANDAAFPSFTADGDRRCHVMMSCLKPTSVLDI